jgi:hypothetical protein
VVHLGQRGHRTGEAALFLQLGHPEAVQLHRGDLGEHGGELVLDELEARDRFAELRPLHGVGQRGLVGRDGVAQ